MDMDDDDNPAETIEHHEDIINDVTQDAPALVQEGQVDVQDISPDDLRSCSPCTNSSARYAIRAPTQPVACRPVPKQSARPVRSTPRVDAAQGPAPAGTRDLPLTDEWWQAGPIGPMRCQAALMRRGGKRIVILRHSRVPYKGEGFSPWDEVRRATRIFDKARRELLTMLEAAEGQVICRLSTGWPS